MGGEAVPFLPQKPPTAGMGSHGEEALSPSAASWRSNRDFAHLRHLLTTSFFFFFFLRDQKKVERRPQHQGLSGLPSSFFYKYIFVYLSKFLGTLTACVCWSHYAALEQMALTPCCGRDVGTRPNCESGYKANCSGFNLPQFFILCACEVHNSKLTVNV